MGPQDYPTHKLDDDGKILCQENRWVQSKETQWKFVKCKKCLSLKNEVVYSVKKPASNRLRGSR